MDVYLFFSFLFFERIITPQNSLEIRWARTYCACDAYERVVNVIRDGHVYTGERGIVARIIEFLRVDCIHDRCIEWFLKRLIQYIGQPYQ